MAGHHLHDHDHPHAGDAHAPIGEHATYRAESLVLEQALRELLIEKEVFSAEDIQRQIEDTESRNPGLGARVVARAWTDPDFKSRLLADAKAAVASLGIDVTGSPALKVVENTQAVHHMIVCTLCSCYPKVLLGIPPAWYKSPEYRSRAVIEPRAVLAEFGTTLPDDVEVQVVDSTADLRYMVLPARPAGTEEWDEAALAGIVNRDAMIGVSQVRRE
jgi:nitrile hydratase alpha subunit